jgi:Fe-S cluster assembly protein SufD
VSVPAFVSALASRSGPPGWWAARRSEAMDAFAAVGLPTPKLEDWKYTSLAPLQALGFGAGPASATRAQVEALAGANDSPQFVFVNGRPSAELSRWGKSAGLSARLFSAGDGHLDQASRALGAQVTLAAEPMAALNTALFEDGVAIELAPEAKPGLLHLVYLNAAADPVAAFPRVVLLVGAGADVTVLQSFVGAGGARSLTDAVVEVELGTGARLTVYTLQRQPDDAAHVAHLYVRQAANSHFASHALALGSALARDEVRVRFDGEGSSCTLNGLYLGTGTQHLDQHTLIDHAHPRCTSRELYKGVLRGQAHGVFTGRVIVREDAQKTDSSQTHKNLLLSDSALVDARPQLEIFADDVKCTHGSAVGQLDEAALFYLRSRGLDLESARRLLTEAFVSEVFDAMPNPVLRLKARELAAGHWGAQA